LRYSKAVQLHGKTKVDRNEGILCATRGSVTNGRKKTTPTAIPETTLNVGGMASIESNFHIEATPTIMLAKQRVSSPVLIFWLREKRSKKIENNQVAAGKAQFQFEKYIRTLPITIQT
jgi:hypothetical protein